MAVARDVMKIIRSLPPIDWSALVQRRMEEARNYPGAKRTPAEIAHHWKVRRRNYKAKTREAAKRHLAERSKEYWSVRLKRGELVARTLAVMEPGCWYAWPDVARAAGSLPRSGRISRGKLSSFLKQGWVERADNPDYRPTNYRKGVGIDVVERGDDVKFLYRLTPAGEQARRERAFLA